MSDVWKLVLGCFGLRCLLGWCGGHVVSGIHDDWIWVGWQCHDCKCVKHYGPVCKLDDVAALDSHGGR